jgi:high-affinity iron transporter
MSTAFIQAAVILLREGLEAMLVIAALAGYLNKVGAGHRIRALYGGALTAVGASIIAAWLFAVLNSGEHSDILEGIIILVAAGLMLYVSGWLMVKQDPKGWNDYLAHKADTALAQDTVWAVGALAFLAVFREGAETVLFINALATTGRRLERRAVCGTRRRDAGSRGIVLFNQSDRAKTAVAAPVHHHLGLPVRDGNQVHR